MRIQKDQFSQVCSIIGLDLFTCECPGLNWFKTFLLTGQYKNAGADCQTEVIDQSLQALGFKKSAFDDLTLYDRLLLLVMKRSINDAELDQKRTDEIEASTVIHFPTGTFKEPHSIDPNSSEFSLARITKLASPTITFGNSVIIHGSFEDALERSLVDLQNTSCSTIALFSFFHCSSLDKKNADRDSTHPTGETERNLSTGLGCVVLSNQTNIINDYADLIWEKSQVNEENGKDQLDSVITESNHSVQPIFNTSNNLQTTNSRFQSANPPVAVLTEVENWVEKSDEEMQCEEYSSFQSAPIIKLIQSALSLNSRTLYPDPEPSWKDEKLAGEESGGFIRPWFPLPYAEKHETVIRLQGRKDYDLSIRLEKGYLFDPHPEHPFLNFGLYLLPINLDDPQQCIQRIDEIKNEITDCPNLASFINESLAAFENQKSGTNTLVVLGSTRKELSSELEHAQKGISKSLKDGRDWQTPAGSYFTPNPFGPEEKIAFVYPGAFGTYIGMGREIFYLFPQLHDALLALTADPGNAINEMAIFPQKLTSSERERLQNELNDNPTQMISSGICFSYLFTVIMRDIFKVNPDAAFGYSLGENSMMFAMGIWAQADAMRTSLEASTIFHTRVSGPQNAIREYWKMPVNGRKKDNSSIWANYVLMAPFEKVREAIQNEDHVYITHINAPRQVVIGGEKNTCQRVADALRCMHLQAPYNHAIHCEPVASEFDAFMRLHDWPVENKPDIPIFTAANYATLQNDSRSIAKSFARMLTNPIDFPRLVNLAYKDGARIFIELGAGSNCSKWVEAVLKGKPHTTMTINQNNINDHVSILRLLARLVSHQIPVELKALRSF